MTNDKIRFKTIVMLSGAFAAYNIGAGFASGQEVLQFFGSWGSFWPLVLPLIALIINIIYTSSCYHTGATVEFSNPSEAYEFYGGKWFAKFMDVFSIVMIASMGLSMFAGCGATVNQYLGLPVYVGAVILGILSVIVVWFGLDSVTNVLGVAGILIILCTLLVTVYSFFAGDTSFAEANSHITGYVQSGDILQASVAGIKSPILSGCFYGGVQVLTCFHFIIGNGAKLDNSKEAFACGIGSAVLFIGGIYLVDYAVISNIDYIVEKGAQVPMLAVIEKLLPALAPVFALVIVVGIFTTITGYLWTIGRRFAEDKTTKQRIIVCIVTVLGIFGGSLIPFSNLVNFFSPLVGLVGFICFIVMIVHDLKGISQNKKAQAQQ